jgi:hypothetical protein
MTALKNIKREAFANEMATYTPVDRAYALAGFKDGPNARSNGSRLAHEPDVDARIQELRAEFRQDAWLHVEYLQRLLLPVAEAKISDFYARDRKTKKLRLKMPDELTADQARAVSEITFDGDTPVKMKLHGKSDAVRTLLQSVGALLERHSLDLNVPMNDAFGGMLERLTAADRRELLEGMKQLNRPSEIEATARDVTPVIAPQIAADWSAFPDRF